MNRKRIVIGGVVAGLVLFVLEGIATAVFLTDRYRSLAQAGVYNENPRLPFYPVWVLVALGIGLGLAWLYASVRPRLGPGPGTAALLGLVVGLMIYTPGSVATFAWTHEGGFVALVRLVAGSIGSVIAALVAGAIYREGSTAAGPGP
jgi:hypothetical protein